MNPIGRFSQTWECPPKDGRGKWFSVQSLFFLGEKQFDPNLETEENQKAQTRLKKKFLPRMVGLLNGLERENTSTILIRVAQPYFSPFKILNYKWFKESIPNFVVIQNRWPKGMDGGSVEDNCLIFPCPSQEILNVLKRYWYFLACDVQVELFLIPKEVYYSLGKSNGIGWFSSDNQFLKNASRLYLDNQVNGFHFFVSGGPEWKEPVNKFLLEINSIPI